MGWRNSPAKHNVVYAGRRSYKTESAKRKLIRGTEHHPGAIHVDGGNLFFAAPTFQQAKRIAWNDLKLMTRPLWKGKPSESEMVISLHNNARIFCLGLDKPERIEGMQWHGGNMDEYANMKANAWAEHVQPVTADTGAWVDFTGVPEGRNHFYELATDAVHWNDWAAWHWISADVLPADKIEAAKATLDPRAYRQEYEATFEASTVEAYYGFATANVGEYPYVVDAETYVCWDFNAGEKPMAVSIVQDVDDHHRVVKDWAIPYTNTEQMATIVYEWLYNKNHAGKTWVTGDYSGKRRESNASFSDYEIIESKFKNFNGYKTKMRPTLAVKDRVASLNRLIETADGKRRLRVDTSCEATIKDLTKTSWKQNGMELDQDTDPTLTHLSDGLSYWAYNFHGIDRKDKQVTVN